MKKAIKIFGIGAAVLFVLMALAPACTAEESDGYLILLRTQVTAHETIFYYKHSITGEHWNLIIPHWHGFIPKLPYLICMD